MKTYYHGTSYENMLSIVSNGIEPSIDGLVYLCEKPEHCARFCYMHGIKNIVVFKVKIPKKLESRVIETFDHSYKFFNCKSFGFEGRITSDMITPFSQYDMASN